MEYIHLQGKYFMGFIDKEKYGSIQEYIIENKRDKVWGDNIEIQAMAELYAMPIEIFEYTVTPARVFNKEKTRREKYGLFLRLSYHSKNHYNAVVPANKSKRTAIYS